MPKHFLLILMVVMVHGLAFGEIPLNSKCPQILEDSSGHPEISPDSLRGKVTLINFWASWCMPCRAELPYFNTLYSEYPHDSFAIVGISIDKDKDNADKLVRELRIAFPIIHDSDQEIARKFAPTAMPTTFVVDRTGDVRFIHHGFTKKSKEEFKIEIEQLLAEKNTSAIPRKKE